MRINTSGKSMCEVLALTDRLGSIPQLGIVGISPHEISVTKW